MSIPEREKMLLAGDAQLEQMTEELCREADRDWQEWLTTFMKMAGVDEKELTEKEFSLVFKLADYGMKVIAAKNLGRTSV
jgi:hypothetical protein